MPEFIELPHPKTKISTIIEPINSRPISEGIGEKSKHLIEADLISVRGRKKRISLVGRKVYDINRFVLFHTGCGIEASPRSNIKAIMSNSSIYS